jgi:hypothetical protein
VGQLTKSPVQRKEAARPAAASLPYELRDVREPPFGA